MQKKQIDDTIAYMQSSQQTQRIAAKHPCIIVLDMIYLMPNIYIAYNEWAAPYDCHLA